jgi:nitronate monooxygenase
MKTLGLRIPLIVAPMAAGPSTVALVAESSRAGALGSIGAAYSTPAAIEEFAASVRARTDKPFAINLFLPHPPPAISSRELEKAIGASANYRTELGLPEPKLVPPYEEDFSAQFEAVLRIKPAVLSTVFGLLDAQYLQAAKRARLFVIGTATSFEEARAQEESGADAVVLQGVEAGGHRGIFDPNAEDPKVSMLDLLHACVGKLGIPLIAAGGIMNQQDIRTALGQGAAAVQIGTAFLACEEAGTSAPYKAKLLETQRTTKTTRVFSGRLARGIENRFMREMDARPDAVLPFPAQNKFTRDLRTASAARGSAEFLSLWSGSGEGALWQGPIAEAIETLFPRSS